MQREEVSLQPAHSFEREGDKRKQKAKKLEARAGAGIVEEKEQSIGGGMAGTVDPGHHHFPCPPSSFLPSEFEKKHPKRDPELQG